MKWGRRKRASPLNSREVTSAQEGGACNNRESATTMAHQLPELLWSEATFSNQRAQVLLLTLFPASAGAGCSGTCTAACYGGGRWIVLLH